MFKPLAAAVAAAALAAGAGQVSAQPAIGADPLFQPAAIGVYFFGGHRFCWYDNAWNGPGWYWCGYPWRRGIGWGGGWGWRGWVGGHPHGWYRGRGWHGGDHGDHDGGRWGHGDHGDRWDRGHDHGDHGARDGGRLHLQRSGGGDHGGHHRR